MSEEMVNKAWAEFFNRLIEISPKNEQLSPSDKVLRLCLKRSLEKLVDRPKEEAILLSASKKLLLSKFLEPSLYGDHRAHQALINHFITAYLNLNPMGEMSERDLAELWYAWAEQLCDHSGEHIESLWIKLPSVKLAHWFELGFSQHLEESFDRLKRAEPGQVMGICLSGAGGSAHLAYARRWFKLKEREAEWLSVELSQECLNSSIVLIDHIDRGGREAHWLIGSWLAQEISEPRLILWTERARDQEPKDNTKAVNSTQRTLTQQLREELSEVVFFDLDKAWTRDRPRYEDSLDRPKWMYKDAQSLSWRDELRLMDLISSPPRNQPELYLSDLDALAALIGPLTPIKVLTVATGSEEEVIRTLLKGGAWTEVDDCPFGGGIFTPSSTLSWRAALAEGGRRAHRYARVLVEAIESIYPPHERTRWCLANVLERLSILRGRSSYTGQIEGDVNLDVAHKVLGYLQEGLKAERPKTLTLTALSGLAFDWGRLGPLLGRWSETMRALQLGVAAAERLKDPRLASRLSLLLGELALSDGRCALAEGSLELALTLSYALRESQVATRSAQLLAELKLFQGEIDEAIKKNRESEKIARSLATPSAAWRARFREGQFYASLDDHAKAISIWESLKNHTKDDEASPQSEALITLYLELSSSALKLDRYELSSSYLSLLPNDRLEVRVLSAIKAALVEGDDPTEILTQALITYQQNREIGAWFALQDWRARLTVLTEKTEHPSNSPLLTLKECRLGLELAVRVATGSRDRLRLIHIYKRLSEVYYKSGEVEASTAALAMVEAWQSKVSFPEGYLDQHFLLDEVKKEISSMMIEETRRAAHEEVDTLITRWRDLPLSEERASPRAYDAD